MLLPVLLGYNVYLVGASAPASAGTPAPVPLNAAPLATPTFQDTTFTFDAERCYEVRAVNAVGLPAVPAANTPPIPGAPAQPPQPALAGPPRPPVVDPAAGVVRRAAVGEDLRDAEGHVPAAGCRTSLAAVGSAGAINLIWEGVEAADLAGYILLRGHGARRPDDAAV